MKLQYLLLLLCAAFAPALRGQTDDEIVQKPIYTRSDGTVLWDDCGGKDERACLGFNPSFRYLPGSGTAPRCDRTLDVSFEPGGAYCRALGRRSIIPTPAYLQSKIPIGKNLVQHQDDQFSRISADLPINLVPIIGTHNSYSNYQDGGDSIFNVDQDFTISDQLQLGARHLRLDPVAHISSNTPILCHETNYDIPGLSSFNLPTNERELCGTSLVGIGIYSGSFSYSRPVYLAVRELRNWLDAHPSEFVILRINFVSQTVEKNDILLVLRHELGDRIYPLNTTDMPTLREIRAAGKQVFIHSAASGFSTNHVWRSDEPYPNNSTSNIGFPFCLDHENVPVGIGRPQKDGKGYFKWSNIGEDRSLSNIAEAPNGFGLISALETELATHCGYSMIGFDFLHALPRAVKINLPTGTVIDFSGPSPDPRPGNAIWSWLPSNALDTPLPATLERFNAVQPTLTPQLYDYRNYRMSSAAESTALRFACAGPKNVMDPRNYTWAISTGTGVWKNGEDACQAIGPTYHFWRPMSGPEKQTLVDAMKAASVNRVWLNHYPQKTYLLPADIQIDATPSTPYVRDVLITSGYGGKFRVSFTPSNGAPNFLVVPGGTLGNPIFTVWLNNPALASASAGIYQGVLRVEETIPGTSQVGISESKVILNFTRPDGALVVNPNPVNFLDNPVQTVQITSSSIPATLEFNQQIPVWLTASLNRLTTPAVMTLTADLSKITGPQSANLTIRSQTSGVAGVTFPINIDVSQTTFTTNPAGVELTIDGVPTATPATRSWLVNTVHSIEAPATVTGIGSRQTFTGWSNGLTQAAASLPARSGLQTITANYAVSRLLTLGAQPVKGGTLSVANPSADGYYPDGATVSLIATPAPGFVFQRFSGDSIATISPASLTMNRAKQVTAIFVSEQGKTTINSVPSGLSVLVDGVTYTTPASFVWPTGESHSVAAPLQAGANPGVRYSFDSWADGNLTSPRTINGASAAATYTAVFNTEYQVSVNVAPSNAGTVKGPGWYRVGSSVTLQPQPAAGFQFANFTGIASPQIVVDFPINATANFTAIGAPILVASSAARTDLGNGTVRVPLVLSNLGAGPAGDAVITGLDSFQTPLGAGAVTPVFPPGGIAVGTIFPKQTGQTVVDFAWPTSATRVTFRVLYKANNGAYSGANTITLFR